MSENLEMNPETYDESVYGEPYCTQNNCLYEKRLTKDGIVHIKLADFVPVLKSEITYDNGQEQKKHFRIGGMHASGVTLPETVVTAEEMHSMKWMLNRWGTLGAAQPTPTTLNKIGHAITLTKENVAHETIYLQTGWKKIGDRYVFLMPEEDSPFTVELSGKLKRYSFDSGASADLSLLASMLKNSFAPERVMFPLLSITFLSPLNSFLNDAGCVPKFALALVGRTGSRKSTLAALFLSFFGRFTASDLPMSFHDTSNSISESCYYLKDTLTCIDDLHPSGSKSETAMRDTLQDISRYFGDRIGRARLNSKSELMESKPPLCNAIITAEYMPEISVSGQARYLTVELKENDVRLDILSEYQKAASSGALVSMMKKYIRWLYNNFISEYDMKLLLADWFRRCRKCFRNMLNETGKSFHNRVPDMLAHLKISFLLLLKFLKDNNALSEEDADRYSKEYDSILIENVTANAESIESENPAIKFLDKLRSLLDSGKSYVVQRGGETARGKGYVGLEDESHYYLLTDAAYTEVRKACSEAGEHFTITKNQLLKDLGDGGYLVRNGNRNTTNIRDNSGKTINVAVINKGRLQV